MEDGRYLYRRATPKFQWVRAHRGNLIHRIKNVQTCWVEDHTGQRVFRSCHIYICRGNTMFGSSATMGTFEQLSLNGGKLCRECDYQIKHGR